MIDHVRRGKISTKISTAVENRADIVLFPLTRRPIGVRNRESVALSLGVFNDESDAFQQASVLHFKFSWSTRNAAEDVPTKQPSACKNTWFSGADEIARGTARAEGQA